MAKAFPLGSKELNIGMLGMFDSIHVLINILKN